MNRAATWVTLVSALLLCAACSSLYTSTVTITSVVDAGMKDWAQLSVAGKTSAAIDAKIVAAHDNYRAACGVAQAALIKYKEGGDSAAYVNALKAVRAAADMIFVLIDPLISPAQATALKAKLAKASSI